MIIAVSAAMANKKKLASRMRCAVVVVGDSRAGKSALIRRFVDGEFSEVGSALISVRIIMIAMRITMIAVRITSADLEEGGMIWIAITDTLWGSLDLGNILCLLSHFKFPYSLY